MIRNQNLYVKIEKKGKLADVIEFNLLQSKRVKERERERECACVEKCKSCRKNLRLIHLSAFELFTFEWGTTVEQFSTSLNSHTESKRRLAIVYHTLVFLYIV